MMEIKEILYKLASPFRYIKRLYRRVKRGYKWAKFMDTNYEWDALTLYNLIGFKLEEVQKCILEDPYHEHQPKDVKALRVAIKLTKRLHSDFYEERCYDRHERKWGKLLTESMPIENSHCISLKMWREFATTPELKEQERKECLDGLRNVEHFVNRDKTLLFNILKDNLSIWWT